ncbi:MAG: hypothetical protein QFX32_04275 [Methanolinea sp.]|nr:hypothetical protein [Methanolinea sp.]
MSVKSLESLFKTVPELDLPRISREHEEVQDEEYLMTLSCGSEKFRVRKRDEKHSESWIRKKPFTHLS